MRSEVSRLIVTNSTRTNSLYTTWQDLERLSFIHSPSLSPLRNGRKSPMPKSHLSSFAIGWKEPASNDDSDDYSAAAAAAEEAAAAAGSDDSSAAVPDVAVAPQLQLPPALQQQQQQQVRRGRRIAGVNKHVCNDDYKKLQDRFSGWT
jgi:hypothetical protein